MVRLRLPGCYGGSSGCGEIEIITPRIFNFFLALMEELHINWLPWFLSLLS